MLQGRARRRGWLADLCATALGGSHCLETARGSPMRGTSASRHSIACKMKNRLTMNHKVSAIAAGMRNQCSVKSSWSRVVFRTGLSGLYIAGIRAPTLRYLALMAGRTIVPLHDRPSGELNV